MNNSLPRLIDGMAATLREVLLPQLQDDFARGQVFGIIYMLNSIKRRATWSNEFLGEQLRALEELGRELVSIAPELPRPRGVAVANLPDAGELEALRDAGDESVCELIDWLAGDRAALPEEIRVRVDEVLHRYMTRQLKWDVSTSAKPMFEEISRGAEKND